jgi:alanyl-tRNA synthetase
MNTEKLYEADPFMREFRGKVLACTPSSDGYIVILDRTAFYPEGGGQPADRGTLNGASVLDVQERDGEILHRTDQPLQNGETAEGRLDWSRRFDHMQQHSGEHILSGILCRDYHCDNVGFHLGAETVTIDYNTELSWEQAVLAESKANAVIASDRPVEITYPSREELERISYRSKKEISGPVRIVTFPEADCCACCGTHVRRAGQVELVKLLSLQKFRSGVRMEIVCGRRALELLGTVYDQNRLVAQSLSVKMNATAEAVARTLEELSQAKIRAAELEDQIFQTIAEKQTGRGDVVLFQENLRPDGVRRLADAVAHTCGGLAAVFSPADGKTNYALVQADGKELRDLVRSLNTALHGRGGGRNGFAQGSVQAGQKDIEAFFRVELAHSDD